MENCRALAQKEQFSCIAAVCRHLGCLVAWNADEQTWDRPYHGSRYDRFGRVINGPASSDLAHTNE